MLNRILSDICVQLRQSGYRRLLVLSGENEWVEAQLADITAQLSGDWLTVSSTLSGSVIPEKAHLLLGREFTHAIFDARQGFHSESLAILAGTLKAGSLLVLCTPPQKQWPETPDTDSLRWNEHHGVVATPNFIHHLQRVTNSSTSVLIHQQGTDPKFTLLTHCPTWLPPTGQPTQQQKQALEQLLSAQQGVWGLIAPRGRGKSTVAGMLIQQWQGECWVCAPAKVATEVLEQHAEKTFAFWAPDALLKYCQHGEKINADWLVIDEASAIPTYMLRQIIAYFPRVLMTTTVDGYEGTGRGFISKFCATLNNFTALDLNEPIRFANNDPLEKWLNEVLLLTEPTFNAVSDCTIQFKSVTQAQLSYQPKQLNAFYGLLTSAHYRTSPLDLRRLLDGQGQHFSVASICSKTIDEQYLGALWMVDEGQLAPSLSWKIWAGLRRPRGNLVAQSLAAHSYFPLAAELSSRRVTRIAVESNYRRQQIGLKLIELERYQGEKDNLDFLSVSFGLTPELLSFWQKAGFSLIRIGSHKEASSGCFTAMAIMPLSQAAHQLCQRAEHLLQRDLFWRADLTEFNLKYSQEQVLCDEDWLELVGFSEFNRPLAASYAAIQRLLQLYPPSQNALSLYFQARLPIEKISEQLNLTGKKQWLKQARIDVGKLISQHQSELISLVRQKVMASYS